MKEKQAQAFQNLVDAILGPSAETSASLRKSIFHQAPHVDPVLQSFVEKVTSGGYKVTDEDIVTLHHAGYSDDAIYEIVVCAATGNAKAMLERATRAMEE
jgi:hypothetical protein